MCCPKYSNIRSKYLHTSWPSSLFHSCHLKVFFFCFIRLYERAIVAAGTDFRSDKLWTSYLGWEKELDLKAVTAIYDRLFTIPTQLYSHHYDK